MSKSNLCSLEEGETHIYSRELSLFFPKQAACFLELKSSFENELLLKFSLLITMASLSNDLQGLSLDLPDVVVDTTKAAASSKNRRHRRDRLKKKNLQVLEKKDIPEAEEEPDEDEAVGACALPLDNCRVPEISFPPVGEDQEVSKESLVARQGGSGGRPKRSKKGGKRKRKSEGMASKNAVAAGGENKENVNKPGGGRKGITKDDDTSFPFADDSGDDEEEPKYIWRNVTKNGCIKKCVLVDGKMELGRPKPGDTVLVKTQGKLKDGTIIDDFPTMVFNVGEYEVIDGLDLAVQSMYKNELSIVSIKPELAYGEIGRGTRAPCGKTEESGIPGNARITYLYGLLHFEKAKDINAMTWAQRRKSGQSRLRLANWWYQRKEYPVAVKCYKKALEFYNDIQTNRECSSAEEYKELLQLMEERLRVMRQVANIFKRIANLIQSGEISV